MTPPEGLRFCLRLRLLPLVLALLLAACSAPEGQGFRLRDGYAVAGAAVPAERVAVEVDDERRSSVVLPAAAWSWRGRLPPDAVFAAGVAVHPESAGEVEALWVRAELLLEEGGEKVRVVLDLGSGDGSGWLDLAADLGAYAGREVTLRVLPEVGRRDPEPGEVGGGAPLRLAWSGAAITGSARGGDRPPNVLFILIDTLRADHLTPYGYERDTSPHIQRLLAERGVVVETAYSQAPWTVPSVISYMTGHYPGDLLAGAIEGYQVPAGVPTLAEELAARGYATGAFYGNFILRDENGFGRGFDVRYTPPATPDSNFLHADTVNQRALPWLRAHRHRPFFAYVHYMDPHDPYIAPDLPGYRSPFYPEYSGKLSGIFVHGLYNGRIVMENPKEDVAQITALYDSEIHYVDRAVAELIESLPPEVLAETLIVLTSDHGEELYDHGGWKHGQSLYQEQIHVPLLVRWDGRLPAGERLEGTVQLVDLVPTLLTAVGKGAAAETWQGIDLLPALRGDEPLPRRPAFAQHLASGPLRAAAIYEGRKLFLFNQAEPFVAVNELIDHLWRLDLGRFEPRELYDLESDPGETVNLAGAEPEVVEALSGFLHQRLDHTLPGLRIVASGLPPGAVLSGRIELAGPVEAWHPYFLSPNDRISPVDQALAGQPSAGQPSAGQIFELELIGDAAPVEKGLWIEGDPRLTGIQLFLDGAPLPARAIRLGGRGAPYAGGEVAPSALVAERRPPLPEGPAVRLWRRPRVGGFAGTIDPEVERSLRALGYVQ